MIDEAKCRETCNICSDGINAWPCAKKRADECRARREEDEYLVDRLSHLLAEVAVALKGPELPLRRHGYQDLPRLATAAHAMAEEYQELMAHMDAGGDYMEFMAKRQHKDTK
jgi:hypothetical protein